jgi:hypothetical protein
MLQGMNGAFTLLFFGGDADLERGNLIGNAVDLKRTFLLTLQELLQQLLFLAFLSEHDFLFMLEEFGFLRCRGKGRLAFLPLGLEHIDALPDVIRGPLKLGNVALECNELQGIPVGLFLEQFVFFPEIREEAGKQILFGPELFTAGKEVCQLRC